MQLASINNLRWGRRGEVQPMIPVQPYGIDAGAGDIPVEIFHFHFHFHSFSWAYASRDLLQSQFKTSCQ